MTDIFPLLIINARPAAGKSELLHGLTALPQAERRQRFHLGRLKVFDDFPMLWAWFEEDQILQDVFNRPRLHSTPDGYFLFEDLWHLLVRRLCLDYEKWSRQPEAGTTAVLEFSRGAQHGGYQAAFQHLSPAVRRQAACLYIQVSYQESLRKNRARYNPDRPDSILEHGLSDEKMDRLYRHDDWDQLTAADTDYIQLDEARLPYAVYPNEDDVTTDGGAAMLDRLEAVLADLWRRRLAKTHDQM